MKRFLVGVGVSALAVAVVTAAVALFKPYVPVLSLGVLYVFAVLPVAIFWGLWLALPVSVASMLAFEWFYLPPVHQFSLSNSSDWFALVVYLGTAVVVSELAARSRRRAAAAEQRERESTLLAELATDLLHAALRAGVPVDARIERGRTLTHALKRLWEVEDFEQIVAPAPADGHEGFTEKELAWLLTHAPTETIVLKPAG